ncbi:MAG: ABC-2 transporter permease [Oscillospiraceae bacterium]|nr:ABC-2 transporter permease [Oscillospiraceae bacterium]
MKGLILKDLYQCVRYYKSYLVLVVVFLFSSVNSDSLFFTFYPVMIAGMIPPSLLAYDERSKWDLYTTTLPVTRAQVVSAKYLLGLMVQAAFLLISLLFHTVTLLVKGNFSLDYLGMMISLLTVLSALSSSATLPFMFKLGAEKGRMAYYVMIGLTVGGIAAATAVLQPDLQSDIQLGSVPAILMVLFAGGVYFLSWRLSIRFYEKRELS